MTDSKIIPPQRAKTGIFCIELDGWTFSVRVYDAGYEVAIADKKEETTYVRLDHEQSAALREFVNETGPHFPAEKTHGRPADYVRLPDGVICKCWAMWQEADGSNWCCNPKRETNPASHSQPGTVNVPLEALRNCGCPSDTRTSVGLCTDSGTCGCSLALERRGASFQPESAEQKEIAHLRLDALRLQNTMRFLLDKVEDLPQVAIDEMLLALEAPRHD